MTNLTFATRRSALALAQSRAFADRLRAAHPSLAIEELHVVTSGDRFVEQPLQDLGGKGLFIKELEEALFDGRADFAVHSIKDVPAELAPGLAIACIPEREDPRDALVSRHAHIQDRMNFMDNEGDPKGNDKHAVPHIAYEPDGSWRIVVSDTDPGHPNWVSTAGRSSGLIWLRWFLPDETPHRPVCRVVKVDEVLR